MSCIDGVELVPVHAARAAQMRTAIADKPDSGGAGPSASALSATTVPVDVTQPDSDRILNETNKTFTLYLRQLNPTTPSVPDGAARIRTHTASSASWLHLTDVKPATSLKKPTSSSRIRISQLFSPESPVASPVCLLPEATAHVTVSTTDCSTTKPLPAFGCGAAQETLRTLRTGDGFTSSTNPNTRRLFSFPRSGSFTCAGAGQLQSRRLAKCHADSRWWRRGCSSGTACDSSTSAGAASECEPIGPFVTSNTSCSTDFGSESCLLDLYAPEASLSFCGDEEPGPSVSQLEPLPSPRPPHHEPVCIPAHPGVPSVLQVEAKALFGRRATGRERSLALLRGAGGLLTPPAAAKQNSSSSSWEQMQHVQRLSPMDWRAADVDAHDEPELEYTRDSGEWGSAGPSGLGPLPSITSSQSGLRPSATLSPVANARCMQTPGIQILAPASVAPAGSGGVVRLDIARPQSPPVPSVQQIIQQERSQSERDPSHNSGINRNTSSGCSLVFLQGVPSQHSETVSLAARRASPRYMQQMRKAAGLRL